MRLRTSPAAEFQSLQTRAKMASVLWSRALGAVIFFWVGLTLWVIWYGAGWRQPNLHHAYFGRWILCSVLNDTPFLNGFAAYLPMYANGGWYTLPSFATWLESPALYGESFYQSLWHTIIGYYGFGTDLFPLAIVVLVMIWRWNRSPDGSEHLRGLRLISPREHARQLNPQAQSLKAWLTRRPAPDGIELGSSVIPAEKRFEHFLICGSQGSGKSTLIRQMLRQIEEQNIPAVIRDVDSEFIAEFYKKERGDIVLQPLDSRMPYWSPWSEIREEWFAVDAAAMAASLIRGNPQPGSSAAFFNDGTRTCIESILKVLHDRRNHDGLLRFLTLPPQEIHASLKDTLAYSLIDPEARQQGSGILGTAVNALKTFVHLPTRAQAQGEWSGREWAANPRGFIFLPSREDLRAAISPLQGLWFDCLVRWLMSEDIMSDTEVALLIDEFASLDYQTNALTLLTRGRKRRISCTIGFQNVSQLRAIYGRDSTITLTSSPTTKVILRTDEFETAEWASKLIGAHEVSHLQMSQLAGLSTYREGVTLNEQNKIDHLVLPSQIQMLPPFCGYLCVAGTDRTTITIPKMYLVKRQPAFIPRVKPAIVTTAETVAEEPTDAEIAAQMMTPRRAIEAAEE